MLAERHRVQHEPQALGELPRKIRAAVRHEREQAGGVAELPARERRLVGGPGVEHAADARMALEELRHLEGALLVGAHPERERHEAPEDEARRGGAHRRPEWTSASWRSDAIAARRPMTTPPRASPCPQAYFVSEWTT